MAALTDGPMQAFRAGAAPLPGWSARRGGGRSWAAALEEAVRLSLVIKQAAVERQPQLLGPVVPRFMGSTRRSRKEPFGCAVDATGSAR